MNAVQWTGIYLLRIVAFIVVVDLTSILWSMRMQRRLRGYACIRTAIRGVSVAVSHVPAPRRSHLSPRQNNESCAGVRRGDC